MQLFMSALLSFIPQYWYPIKTGQKAYIPGQHLGERKTLFIEPNWAKALNELFFCPSKAFIYTS